MKQNKIRLIAALAAAMAAPGLVQIASAQTQKPEKTFSCTCEGIRPNPFSPPPTIVACGNGYIGGANHGGTPPIPQSKLSWYLPEAERNGLLLYNIPVVFSFTSGWQCQAEKP